MNDTEYIGLDVHQTTISALVPDLTSKWPRSRSSRHKRQASCRAGPGWLPFVGWSVH